MHFVNRLRRAQRVALAALLHPLLVAPLVVQIPHDRCSPRRLFMQKTNGISLIDAVSVAIRFNVEFIERAVARPCDEAFPDSRRTAGVEPMRFGIPFVKTAY